jgi:hypothetical protein
VGVTPDAARWLPAVRALFAWTGRDVEVAVDPAGEPDVLVFTGREGPGLYHCARRLCIDADDDGWAGLATETKEKQDHLHTVRWVGGSDAGADAKRANVDVHVPRWCLSMYARAYPHASPRDVVTWLRGVREPWGDRPNFCAYLERESTSRRNAWFDRLSAYAPVTPLGWHRGGTLVEGGHDGAVRSFATFRFVLVVEREGASLGPGVLSALLAGCVPLYAGAADALRYLTPDCFVPLDEADPAASVRLVASIDAHATMRLAMQRAPALTKEAASCVLDPEWAYTTLSRLL